MIVTEAVIIAAIASLPPTLAALAALVVSMKTDRKADKIQTSVNGNVAALTVELRRANEIIAAMSAARFSVIADDENP